MRKAASIIYIIGIIFAIIGAISLFVSVGVVNSLTDADIKKILGPEVVAKLTWTIAQVRQYLQTGCIVYGIVMLLSAVLCFFGYRACSHGSDGKMIHVFIIIISVLSFDILLLLGGIFGAIGASEEPAYQD